MYRAGVYVCLLVGCGLLAFTAQESTSDAVIAVSVSCPDHTPSRQAGGEEGSGLCVEIDQALDTLSSDTVLELELGTHLLRRSHATSLAGLRDIVIHGSDSVGGTGGEWSSRDEEEVVVLTCEEDVGLAFVNVTRLTLSHVTVTGCGLGGELLNEALNLLGGGVATGSGHSRCCYAPSSSPSSSPEARVAVLMGGCCDTTLLRVGISDTAGLGLLGINLLGTSNFSHLNITNNTHFSCETGAGTHPSAGSEPQQALGGGAVFLYEDVGEMSDGLTREGSGPLLTITDSVFSYNTKCSTGGQATPTPMEPHPPPEEGEWHLCGGGGGLAVLLMQSGYGVEVRVQDSTFHHNAARDGGGGYMGVASGVGRSQVSFMGCVFERNGLSSRGGGHAHSGIADLATCLRGAGLFISTGLRGGVWVEERSHDPEITPTSIVRILESHFSHNAALWYGGGVAAESALTTSNTVPTSVPLSVVAIPKVPPKQAAPASVPLTQALVPSTVPVPLTQAVPASVPPTQVPASVPMSTVPTSVPPTSAVPSTPPGRSLPMTWLLEDCLFHSNTARQGSAGHFYTTPTQSNQDHTLSPLLTLRDINITRSTMLGGGATPRAMPLAPSALGMANMWVWVEGALRCEDNLVTGLHMRSSRLELRSEAKVTFRRNLGHLGGALIMEGENPLIKLNKHTTLVFESNIANIKGGAIFISAPNFFQFQEDSTIGFSSCFLQPPTQPNCSQCYLLSDQDSLVRFHHNQAPLGGTVYGSTLRSCRWVEQLEPGNETVYRALWKDKSSFVKFDTDPNSLGVVSTRPVKISVAMRIGGGAGGDNEVREATLYPGQRVPLRIRIYDDLGQFVPSVVQSATYRDQLGMARLGTTGVQLVGGGVLEEEEWPILTVTGREGHTFNVTVIEFLSVVSAGVNITLRSCALGFLYDESEQACMCDPRITHRGVACDLNDMESLRPPPNVWIGTLEPPEQDSPPNTNATITTGDLVVNSCQLRFCQEGGMVGVVIPYQSDSLCARDSNKSGVLCGACAPNHSAVLGAYGRCARCSHYWLALLPAFGVAGVLLFLLVAFFRLTVDTGWVYTVVFYCNTITVYTNFLPADTQFLHYALIPASLVSLQLGYESCLYEGMDTLAHVWLQLAFPAYLFLLMLVFALLSRRSSWLSRRFSPAPTLLTLWVMSYTSVLETCVSAVYGTRLSTLGGGEEPEEGGNTTSSLRWQADANVVYFTGWHAPLVVLSGILLLFYVVPLPLVMMFPMLAYKHTGHLTPIFDAMWAPFQTRLRPWLGVRFLVLVVLYMLAYLDTGGGGGERVGAVAFGLTLLLYNQLQSSLQPFRERWVERIDGWLVTTILVLLAVTYRHTISGGGGDSGAGSDWGLLGERLPLKARQALAGVCLGVGYVLVLMAVWLGLWSRFSEAQGGSRRRRRRGVRCLAGLRGCCWRVREAISRRKRRRRSGEEGDLRKDVVIEPTNSSFRVPRHQRLRHLNKSFSQLRETLLETQDSH